MAADGPTTDGNDEFDPRSSDLEYLEEHVGVELTAPDEKL